MYLLLGDITTEVVDVIVNAANEQLAGGGGVDGAIHRSAGPELLEACRPLAPCPTGDVRVTEGYQLAASHIIHAVGPVWRGGTSNEDALLQSCYEQALRTASERGWRSISFPSISTGAYRFPFDRAAAIALTTSDRIQQEVDGIEAVRFVCFSEHDFVRYQRIASKENISLEILTGGTI